MTALDRFVTAQDRVWPGPLEEVRAGRKVSHWMWFVFPQLRGLGLSDMALRYGIADAGEAAAYLAHPLLGPRLAAISGAVLAHRGTTADDIFGPVDAMKLRSCMTLFAAVPGAPAVFGGVLDGFFAGRGCPLTLARLS